MSKETKNSKSVNPLTSTTSTQYEEWTTFKSYILDLQKANILDTIRFDEKYFSLMKNEWLLDKYIWKYGVVDEDNPPNTISAYKKAAGDGYGILIGVQMLKDGNIVCYREKSLGKLADKNGYLSNLTLEEIKKYKIGDTDCTIPTLQEALETIQGKSPIMLEIFNEAFVGKMEEVIERILDEYVAKYKCIGSVAVMSINPFVLEWFFLNAPWYTRVIKSCFFKNTKEYANIKTEKLKKLKFRKISHSDLVCYNAQDLPNKYIKKCKPVGVIAYNVKEQAEYEKLLKHCDNMIFTGFIPTI